MSASIVVVGAVIMRDGLILCAQRGKGPLAGLWEFPGGKVEPGEEPRAALRREIAEELGCVVDPGEQLAVASHAYDFGIVQLTTYACELRSGTPTATEHTALSWLAPPELARLAWAPVDVTTVDLLVGR